MPTQRRNARANLPTVDAHCHMSRKRMDSPNESDPNRLLRSMDAANVEHAILIGWPFQFGDLMSNVELLEFKRGLPEELNRRFSLAAGVTLTGSDAHWSLSEVEKLAAEHLIVGVKVYLGYEHFYPSDDVCQPVYKLCCQYDLPVIFHSGDTAGYPRAMLKYTHPLHIDQVAVENPDLRIVISHLGNPWNMDAATVAYKNNNVFCCMSGFFDEDVQFDQSDPYIRRMTRCVEDALSYMGSGSLLFATDYPIIKSHAYYVQFVEGLELSADDYAKIMVGNARSVYRI